MKKSIIAKLAKADWIWTAVLYLVAIVAMSWPAAAHLSDRLIGNNIDNWIFYWNNYWVKQALLNGESVFGTKMIFFPTGTSLVAHSHSLLNSLMAMLLETASTFSRGQAVSPVAAHNLTLLMGLWVGALGMFLLVRQLTDSWIAAFVAGFVFTFTPYHLSQSITHLHLGSIHWYPFYGLMLHKLLRRPRWQYGVGAGIFAALTFYSGVQLALLLMVWTAVTLIYEFASGEWRIASNGQSHNLAAYIFLIGVTAVILSLPILIPLAQNWEAVVAAPANFDESTTKQTDLLSYWVPPTWHPFWGEPFQPIYERFIANRTSMSYIGYGVLILIIVAVWKRWRASRFWLFSALIWLLLAAGPIPRINGQLFEQIQLPYSWIGSIFPISTIRAPDRFNLLLVFSVAVLSGLGTAAISSWGKTKDFAEYTDKKRAFLEKGLLYPLIALIIIEYLAVPLPMWELPPVSPFMTEMAKWEPTGVVDYPMGYSLSKLWLYYQTIHNQPIVEGHVSRFTDETYAFISQQPLLDALYANAERPPHVAPSLPPPPLSALGPTMRSVQAQNINIILLHKPYADAAQINQLQRILPFVPIYEDETLAVYDLKRPFTQQFTPSIRLTPQISLIQSVPSLSADQIQLQLLTQLENGTGSTLCSAKLGTVSATEFRLFDENVAWQAGDLENHSVLLPVPNEISIGEHQLNIQCKNGENVILADRLVVLDSGEKLLLRHQTAVIYQDEIELLGYRTWMEGATMKIAFSWRSLVNSLGAYKLFVHLLDGNGRIVQQYDAVPCQWTCPTEQWQKDELIYDEGSLDLWGLPTGEYQLAIGLYRPDTGQRLIAKQLNGQLIPDAYLVLPDFVLINK